MSESPSGGGIRGVVIGIIVLFVGMLVLPAAGLFAYGLFLPDEYVTVVSGVVSTDAETVYDTLADSEQQGDWRPGVTTVQPVEDETEFPVILVSSGGTELALRRVEAVRPRRVVWEVIPSKKHVFQGVWSYELREETEGATRVTITERGIIDSPFARGVTHGLFGTDQFAKASLRTLGRVHQVAVVVDEG